MAGRIIAAAIKKRGIVFTGVRHGHIIRDMVAVGFLKDQTKDYVEQSEQGFIDEQGIYHDREESRRLAIFAGQINKHHGTLYSEDLW